VPKSQPESYKQLSEQLAETLAWFESEDIDLDKAIAKYEEAMRLLQKMETYLKSAENKIQKLAAKFDNG